MMASLVAANAPGAKKAAKEDEVEFDMEKTTLDIRRLMLSIHKIVPENKDA